MGEDSEPALLKIPRYQFLPIFPGLQCVYKSALSCVWAYGDEMGAKTGCWGGWYGFREKTVQVSGGPGPNRAKPAARWKFTDEAVSQVWWVHHYPAGLLPGSGIMHLFVVREPSGCLHGAFQSEFDVGIVRTVPHSNGGGDDTLDGCSGGGAFGGEVQSEKEHPLVSSLDDVRWVCLPFQTAGVGGTRKLNKLLQDMYCVVHAE